MTRIAKPRTGRKTKATFSPRPRRAWIANDGTVLAKNHDLFAVDGNAGVEGFRPGPMDVVLPTVVLLPDILDPMLATNGEPT